MTAGDAFRAVLLGVVCPEDGGDSPFGWWDGGELTPTAPRRPATGPRSAELPPRGLPEPYARMAQGDVQPIRSTDEPTGETK